MMSPPMDGRRGPRGMTVVKPKNMRQTLKRLWVYIERQKLLIIGVIAATLASNLLALTLPYLSGRGVTVIEDGLKVGGVDKNALLGVFVLILLRALLSAVLMWVQSMVMNKVAQDSVNAIRRDAFDKMVRLPLKYYDSTVHGNIISRFSNDVENISNSLSQGVVQLFSGVVTVIGAFVLMLRFSPLLTLIMIVVLPFSFLATKYIAKYSRKAYRAQANNLGELNGMVDEYLSGQKVVKAFAREQYTIQKFAVLNARLKESGTKAQFTSALVPPIMNFINNLGFLLVVTAGGLLAVRGQMALGLITTFIGYSKQFTRPINDMANVFNELQSAVAGAERIFEIFDQTPEQPDLSGASSPEQVKGGLSFHYVAFGYDPGKMILHDLNLEVPNGATVAIVGPTGAGKTTIVNLLMRFYEIDGGEILIDGVSTRKIRRDSLRSLFGMVLQESWLFTGTVRENLTYGNENATEEEVQAAAKAVNLHRFIEALPQGYDTVLSRQGEALSQGQKQLFTIARAMLANPQMLILDEATSSIDTRTEKNIQRAMLNIMAGRTSFVIAHRLSTIRDADVILVMRDGDIVEQGTHQELLAKNGFYAELYNSQFLGMEEETE